MGKTRKIWLVYELHNGVTPRLRTAYGNKKSAYKKVEEWNNREKDEPHKYYIREIEVRR